jgi:hypothetical protein
MTTKPTEARRGMSTLDLEAAYAEFVPKMSGKANASHKFAFGAGVVARARWQARRAALAATPEPVAQPLSMQDLAILEAVRRELDDEKPGNAPGHAHSVVGIWDDDNGVKAGKPCAWCLMWKKFTALIVISKGEPS